MRRISGYVRLQKTNIGIPNLVVAAYDSQRPLEEIVREHKTEKGFKPTIMDHLGTRISSVLTNSKGLFVIGAEDLKFEGNKPRPDLILIVSAPEDVLDVNNPIPLEPSKRILYLSAMPRNDAGAEEAYMIGILKSQLQKFNILLAEAPTETSKMETSLNNHIQNLQNQDNLLGKLQQSMIPRVKKQLEDNKKAKKKIKEKLKNFSAIPVALRKHPNLVKTESDIPKIQSKVAIAALTRIKNFDNNIKIKLSKEDIASLGLKPNKNGEGKGVVPTQVLIQKIRSLTGGMDLVRKNDITPSSITPEALYEKYFSKPKETTKKEKPKKDNDSSEGENKHRKK
ncbi:MAG: hypothetical protein ABIR30_05125 [Chitinophagaceae bacterium]